MKILLTGGSGFIGRHLYEALQDRYTIVAPSHTQFDVTDSGQVDSMFREKSFDAVIHAAVQGGPHVLDTTLRGYWNLARHAARVHRLIYFGSGAEYGKHRDLIKVGERGIGDVTPRDDYGFGKLLCNTLCRTSNNILNLRLFGIYGEFEGYTSKFISNAVAKAIVGLPLVIRQDVVFDYLWVGDLVRLLPTFIEGPRRFADINVTPTESVALSTLARIILTQANRTLEVEVETPGRNFQYTGDNRRLLEYVGDFAFTSIEEGVSRLFAYYRQGTNIDREVLIKDEYRHRSKVRPQQPTPLET